MQNYKQTGDVVPLVAPYAVTSGQGLLVGALFGVATATAASGATVETKTTGVFELTKASGAGWTVGQRLYWDAAARNVTGTATSNQFIGVALVAAASGDVVGIVRLNGVPAAS